VSRSRLVAVVLAALAVCAFAAFGMRGVTWDGHAGSATDLGSSPAGGSGTGGAPLPSAGGATGEPAATRPNVVFILTDDLDYSLMPYMPNVNALIKDEGASFTHFDVEQSSCCPSRASILSGLYAHNHGVIGNVWPEGGYDRWKETKQDDDLPVWLDQAGYRSAMLGKYFNEYPFHPGSHLSNEQKQQLREFVPPGWESWASPVQGNAYAQDHYKLNVDGHVDPEFHTDYLDSFLGQRAIDLVDGDDGFDFAHGGQFIYYASYSPHTPYASPDALHDQFSDVQYPRTPDFDEADVSDKFGLTRHRKPLTAADEATIDETFRERIRSVQTLDANVAKLVQALADQDALDDTYIIFTSDNGYHMGNHRREIGKYTQFQNDVSVPFYIRGPGIAPGSTYDDVAGNIDIAPTIAEIAGASTAQVDGVSLLSRLHGGPPLTRRYYLLGRALTPTNATSATGLEEPTDPDGENDRSSQLNDFTGVTNGRYKLIRFTHLPHEELYDLQNDPYELNNLLAHDQASYAAMTPKGREVVDTLRAALDRLVDCAGVDCQL
jgi:N-acetylglucosamine-6-sulfatase